MLKGIIILAMKENIPLEKQCTEIIGSNTNCNDEIDILNWRYNVVIISLEYK